MVKYIFIYGLFLASPITVTAQAATKSFYLELAIGSFFSVGKFANKTYTPTYNILNNNPSGLAKTGAGISLSLGYRINKSASVILILGGSQNKQDVKPYENYLKQQYGNNITTSVSTGNWKIGRIMAGGSLSIPVTKAGKLYVLPKIFAGICKTTIPGYSFTAIDNNGLITGETRSKENLNWAFCYQAGAGLKYAISSKFYFTFDMNYFGTTHVVKYNYNPNFPVPGPATASGKRKYAISSVNTLLGVGINF
jgi:hypothetical protein